eukprot:gene2802-5645_t
MAEDHQNDCINTISMSNDHLNIPQSEGILLLGGNGCIGSSTLIGLVETHQRCNIVTAHRGRKYWSIPSTKTYPGTVMHFVKIDRKQNRALRKLASSWSIVDFSGYKPQWIHDLFENGLDPISISQYIFISTDSVYEVCKNIPYSTKSHENKQKSEDAALPPEARHLRKKLKKRDRYGYNKLLAEEAVQFCCHSRQIPFVILRLPDVIGPRDTTGGYNDHNFAIYSELYAVLSSKSLQPLPIPSDVAFKPIRIVGACDVAQLIIQLLSLPHVGQRTQNTVYNLACREVLTVYEFAETIFHCCGLTPILPCHACTYTLHLFFFFANYFAYFSTTTEDATQYFPSIDGTPVCIKKAERYLNWNPTPCERIIKNTCIFNFQNTADIGFKEAVDEWISDLQDAKVAKQMPDDVEPKLKSFHSPSKSEPEDTSVAQETKQQLPTIEEICCLFNDYHDTVF